MKKILLMLVATTVVVAFAFASKPETAQAADKPCYTTIKKLKTKTLKKACKTGLKAAKKAMKKIIKETDYECDDCHKSPLKKNKFKLKKNALKKLKKLGVK